MAIPPIWRWFFCHVFIILNLRTDGKAVRGQYEKGGILHGHCRENKTDSHDRKDERKQRIQPENRIKGYIRISEIRSDKRYFITEKYF